MLYSWIGQLVSNYSSKLASVFEKAERVLCSDLFLVDGLRLDSIFNVNQQFWLGFNTSAGVFCIGEGSTDSASSLCPLQWSMDGLLNYPLYHRLIATFNSTGNNMTGLLEGMDEMKSNCRVGIYIH